MDQALADVVKEIEEEKALGRISGVSVFRNMLNQPALMSVSSVNAQPQESGDGFSSFTIDLPRPLLAVKALEMLTCNMPLCTQNIPDTACAFWYYRLSLYSGKYPNINNLFFVRLLPSYYRREFIREDVSFGFNQTFNGYTDLAAQLALACAGDLAQENYTSLDNTFEVPYALPPYYRIQYMKDEAVITYNASSNKFQFAGNQGLPLSDRDPQLVAVEWSAADSYITGDRVKSNVYVQGEGYIVYYALQSSTNQALPVYPREYNTYWSRAYGFEGVANYSATTAYKVGQYVSQNDDLYECIQNAYNKPPSTSPSFWTPYSAVPEFPPVYQYLVAGPNDPDVVFMQGTGQRGWSEYALYEEQDNVLYNGITYKASKQNLGNEPFYVPNSVDNAYSATKLYNVGDYVFYTSKYYINVLPSRGITPTGAFTNNANWNTIVYDIARTNYQLGDIVYYPSGYTDIAFFKCIKENPPANNLTGEDVRFGLNAFWLATYWATGTAIAQVPYVGLAAISGALDMVDDYSGVTHFPYPEGIPPQPFNPNPKRLLNSILGFTWNGRFGPDALSVIYDPITVSGNTATSQLLNRIRPLPVYYQQGPPALGYDPTSTQDTFVFSANGYAVLVYSSIVNVYATIAGAKTLDTQRNTNLIGTMAASAGNLGIAFAASFIDTPLDQYEGDIYNITFDFRDEYGEPYPFTNNAVVSMTFRMRYKSDD